MPKISIIIPIFNAQKYIQRCINSILQQTMDDFEIICVSDGSTDLSLKILQDFAKQDSRIIIIEQQNQGQGNARNNGISVAKGEYIYFIDQDDWIDADMLEQAYIKAKDFDADIIEIPHIYEYGIKTKIHKLKFKLPENKTFNHTKNTNYLFGTSLAGWSRIVKHELIKEYNIRFSKYRSLEDYIYAVNAKIHAKKIVFLNKPMYHYFVRNDSDLYSVSDYKIEAVYALSELKNLLIQTGLFNKYEKNFIKIAINSLSDIYKSIPQDKKEEFLIKCKYLLLDDYVTLIDHIENNSLSFTEQIFSIKNENNLGQIEKVCTLFGCKFIIKKY